MGLSIEHVTKTFGIDHTVALSDVNFEIADGEFVSLTGRSGSGKSTLLYVMSSLDKPTSGKVHVDGVDTAKMRSSALHAMRNLKMGFVFQFHYLLPELTAIENVLMPAMKTKQHEAKRGFGEELLAHFGLKARALIMQPKYLFADEPTGSLDSVNGETVMGILREINQSQKTTIVLVTHEPDYAAYANRTIHLIDGRLAN
jgi:putative ABC transport system ATP-binding protein/lipoprotein-releasing system ATP-binding protein